MKYIDSEMQWPWIEMGNTWGNQKYQNSVSYSKSKICKSLQVLGTNDSGKNVVLLYKHTKKWNNSTDDFSIFKSHKFRIC